MKKKIRDLTLEECEKICDKQEECKYCPLRHNGGCYSTYLRVKDQLKGADLNKEVEIDESSNN